MFALKLNIFLILILAFSFGCRGGGNSMPVTESKNSGNSENAGGAAGGGAGGGGIIAGGWWDSLTSFDNNVTYHINPDVGDGADARVANNIIGSAFVHEYASNKLVILDNGDWNSPQLRFITVNNDNTITADAITAIPYGNNNMNSIKDNDNNIIHFENATKIISKGFFEPVGGTSSENVNLLSYNLTTHAVSVDSFFPSTEVGVMSLNSDETRLILLLADTPGVGDITWKVLDTSNLAAGPLQTGVFNFSSIFPGPAYATVNLENIDDSTILRLRDDDYIWSMVAKAEDATPATAYESPVLVHFKLNPDNTLTVDNLKKDVIVDNDFGGILQYVDNTFLRTESALYLKKLDDSHFALTGEFDMQKSFFGGGWSTSFDEAFIMLGKLEVSGSFTLGTPEIIQQNSGGDYPNFWVYPDTNEIVLMYESDHGEDHYFARNWATTMPLTNYVLHGYSQSSMIDHGNGEEGPEFFVANAAALPVDATINNNVDDIFTTIDTGAMYAWNLDTSAWQMITQIDVNMLRQDGVGFDLSLRSSWGTPIWVMTYDTSTLTISRKKIGASVYEMADYRQASPILNDLWRFHGTKLQDGRIVVNFASSGNLPDTTNTTSHLMVISK